MYRIFKPILAGGNLRDRLFAGIGAVFGIALASIVALALPVADMPLPLPLLVAPIGASAVLVFAVPASPLAQPWPVIGGNVISALVGVTVLRFAGDGAVAAGIAVGGAIAVMSVLRCLHPPGGAAALTAVIGGPAIASAGYAFAFVPVGLNAVALTAAGLLFHRLSGQSYPHRPAPPSAAPTHRRASRDDIDRALDDLDLTLDVDIEDLERLFARVEDHAQDRVRTLAAIHAPRR